MLKSECRGGPFTPEGGTILLSNMSGGDNLLRGAISSVTVHQCFDNSENIAVSRATLVTARDVRVSQRNALS